MTAFDVMRIRRSLLLMLAAIVFISSMWWSNSTDRLEDRVNRLGGSVRTQMPPGESPLEEVLDSVIPGYSPRKHRLAREVVVEIDLRQTDADNSTLEYLQEINTLRYLRLSNTRVDDNGLAHLTELPNLERLSLDNTNVTDAGMQHLKPHAKLRYLHMNGTAVGDSGLEHVAHLRNLRLLTLVKTGISDSGLKFLVQLTNLEHLYLGDNEHVTKQGLRDLVAALPRLKIVVSEFDVIGRVVSRQRITSAMGAATAIEFIGLYNATDSELADIDTYPDLISLSLSGSSVTDTGLKHLLRLEHLQWLDLAGTQVTGAGVDALKQSFPELKVVTNSAQ